MTTKIAVIQKPPVLLRREATIEQMLASIDEAAGAGAGLLVFPEAYIPGYPTWIWRLRPGHARRARRSLDVCGHYARPDLFSLSINRAPQSPVTFSDA